MGDYKKKLNLGNLKTNSYENKNYSAVICNDLRFCSY